MERKLQKNELELWKEITKEDIKINDYISEEETQKKNIPIKKRNLNLKKNSDINEEKNDLVFEKTELKENNFQVNKRMKAKLGRGLIRPEATLDLHGYNRVEAEKALKVFINTCINQEKRCILIVTGKRNTTLGAKSILRELVPSWLDSRMLASLVLAHNYAVKKDGGDGARYVLLRKKRLLNE
jgi:DNA-nicking Smr family endonuclease